jgi:hypothetical protein
VRLGVLRRIWRRRGQNSRRRVVEVDRDPLDALGDEIVSAMVQRIDDRMADAGLIPPRRRPRRRRYSQPDLYVIENSDFTDDPLRAIGVELVAAAHRMTARREAVKRARARRRHQIAVAASTVLFLMVGASAASTVISGTTGIPALDRFLEIRNQRIGNPSGRVPPGGADAPHLATRSDAVPVSGVRLPLAAGAVAPVDVANFLLADGRTCVAFLRKERGRSSSRQLPRTVLGCQPSAELVQQTLAARPAYLVGLKDLYDQTIYVGYAQADTRRVSVTLHRAPLRARLSRTFALPGAGTRVRLFGVVAPRSPDANARYNLNRIEVRAR